MLAPLLAFLLYIAHTGLAIYVQFIKNNCNDMADNFNKICHFHLTTERANNLYSAMEVESMSKEIIKSTAEYKGSLILNNHHSEEKDRENMERLFKIAEDLNYITIQTSAHNVEFIVVFLIIQRTKLRNITKYFNHRSINKVKKINQILFILCLSESSSYSAVMSLCITILILRVCYCQNE